MDLTEVISEDTLTVNWERFQAEQFSGIPEWLIPKAMSEVHPNSFLMDYCAYAANCTDAPAAFHIGIGLSALSVCSPPALTFQPDSLHANFWTAIIGPSRQGRKTHAVTLGKDLISSVMSRDGRWPRLVLEPGSEEALLDTVIHNPQILIWFNEFGAFLSTSSRGYKAPIRDRLTALFDGSPAQRNTVTNKKSGNAQVQPNPRVSLLVAATPAHLEKDTTLSDWTTGFLSRFIFLLGVRDRDWPKARANHIWREGLRRRLLGFSEIASCGPCTDFDEACTEDWTRWRRSLAVIETDQRAEPAIAAAEVVAKKAALLVAFDRMVSNNSDISAPWVISPADLRTGIRIANLHAMSVMRLAYNVADSKDARELRQILALISDGNVPTPLSYILKKTEMRHKNVLDHIKTLELRGEIMAPLQSEDGKPMGYIRIRRRSDSDQTDAVQQAGANVVDINAFRLNQLIDGNGRPGAVSGIETDSDPYDPNASENNE